MMIDPHAAGTMAMSVLGTALEARVAAKKDRKDITTALETAVAAIVTRLAPSTILEIGAMRAEFSISMKAALPDARVIAFEANPANFANFKKRVRQGGVEYRHAAVTDEPGPVTFTVPRRHGAQKASTGSMLSNDRVRERDTYEVEGIRLDDALGDAAGRPNVQWIDVEGAIGNVLAGAPRALDACQLLYAEVETIARWNDQILADDVIARLANHGLIPVLRDVQRHEWQYNCLFLRPDALRDDPIREAIGDYTASCFG